MNIVPFEQLAAQVLTGLIISAGQAGNAANIVKRATTALEIGNALAALAQGNASVGIAALQSALANGNLDPAVQAALMQTITLLSQQAGVLGGLVTATPLVGATAEAIAANIAAGIVAAANAEITKYGNQAKPA